MNTLEKYASLTDSIEMKLDEAGRQAAMSKERFSYGITNCSNIFRYGKNIVSYYGCLVVYFYLEKKISVLVMRTGDSEVK